MAVFHGNGLFFKSAEVCRTGGWQAGLKMQELGDRDHAAKYLRRIVDEMPETAYAEEANGWLANPHSMKKTNRFCIGCHE